MVSGWTHVVVVDLGGKENGEDGDGEEGVVRRQIFQAFQLGV